MAEAKQLGPYELLDKLGSGGMGTVYRALDTRTGAIVAVKVLHEHLTDDIEYVRRFEREAHLASQLDHATIAGIIDSGVDRSTQYLVMELVDGETLFEQLVDQRPLNPVLVRRIAAAVASALDHAHRKGIIHRDIKPGNILLGRDGVIKVSDFGIARAMDTTSQTRTGTFLGSVAYAAAETVNGVADERSDLYSLGVVLYQALLGNVPFAASAPLAVLRMHERETPPELERLYRVDARLAAIIARLLEKKPADRFQSAASLLRALADETSPVAQPMLLANRARRYVAAGSLAVAVTAVLVLGGIALRSGDSGRTQPSAGDLDEQGQAYIRAVIHQATATALAQQQIVSYSTAIAAGQATATVAAEQQAAVVLAATATAAAKPTAAPVATQQATPIPPGNANLSAPVVLNFDSLPGGNWYHGSGGGTASANGGVLTIDAPVGAYNEFILYDPNDEWHQRVSNGVGWVIEARLRVDPSSTPDCGSNLLVWIHDHAYITKIGFSTAAVCIFYPAPDRASYAMNTTDGFHSYRITGKLNNLKIYVDGSIVLERTLSGTGGGSVILGFGDGDGTTATTSRSVSYWDYLLYDVTGIP